jgi:hypothetical protein
MALYLDESRAPFPDYTKIRDAFAQPWSGIASPPAFHAPSGVWNGKYAVGFRQNEIEPIDNGFLNISFERDGALQSGKSISSWMAFM